MIMFKHLFYRIYKFQHNIIGEESDMAALSTIISIAFLIEMNISTVWIYFSKRTETLSQIIDNFNSYFGTIKATPIALGTIVLIPVYFLFFHKKKYLKIIEEVENTDKRKRKINNILAILYQIVTIIVFLKMFFS